MDKDLVALSGVDLYFILIFIKGVVGGGGSQKTYASTKFCFIHIIWSFLVDWMFMKGCFFK